MIAKVVLLFSVVAYVNSFILPGAPPCGCGCGAPLLAPPAACNAPVEFLSPMAAPTALPAALAAQFFMQKPTLAPACGCNALVAPAPLPVVPEVVVNTPLALTPPCGCAGPCGCYPMPVGCTNPFLPAASPMSAMAPQIVSPFLPPVLPSENKCLYLRKIPIPPPVL